ncbi:TAXI family TRAP transporter solute-binding subunit [Oceanobacillus limi]|nr:TAXI family TRAP transporter solute-binding subunit [Oceanobacillus limi]
MRLADYNTYIILFCVVIGLGMLAGCVSLDSSESESSTLASEQNNPISSTIIGGRTGGAWSVFTEGVAESIRRENEDAVITVEPGGIVENPPTVGTNKIPYGLSYSMTAYAAYIGQEPYDKAYKDIRAVSVVIPANYYQFVVRDTFEYDSLDDVIEKQIPIRIAVDQKGSAGEIITRSILRSYGITYDDIISWGGSVDHLGGSKSFELMADKRIDIAGDAVSVPSNDILEASTKMKLKMLSLSKETIDFVSEDLGLVPGTIEAGGYDFLEKNVATVNTPALLLVNKEVSDREVYQVTKAIYNNLEYLRTVHKEFNNLKGENIIDVGEVPLHPGAEKFYREKGLIK